MAINWDLYAKKLNINGNNIRERQINLMKDAYANDFSHSPSYRDAYINNSEDSTGIQVLDTKVGSVKTIHMLPDDILAVGDIIEFDGNKWLCVNAVDNSVNMSGTVNRCTHSITVNKSGVLYEVYMAVESGIRLFQLGLESGKYFDIPETVVTARVSDSDVTENIKRGQVYKVGTQNWKIVDMNDIIEPGLLILKLEWTEKEPESAPEEPKPTQPIEIIGQDSIIFGNTAVYTVNYPEEVVLSLEGEFASIVEQGDNSCTVKAKNKYGYVTLVATSGESEGRKDILIRSYF